MKYILQGEKVGTRGSIVFGVEKRILFCFCSRQYPKKNAVSNSHHKNQGEEGWTPHKIEL